MASSGLNCGPGGIGQRGQGDAQEHFPSPFCDVASLYMPQTIDEAHQWCEYLLMANGPYRSAISRVISYFITDIEIVSSGGQSDKRIGREEKQKYLDFLNDTLGIKNVLHTVALDYLCLSGNTRVPTRNGVFPIRDLVGQTVDVIARDGVYRPATFKHYGEDELWAVTFSDGRVVHATAAHRWYVKNNSSKDVEVTTDKLFKGHAVKRIVAPRPEKNADWEEGVRHGFVFGDGSQYNKYSKNRKTMCVANFFGAKDFEMLQYFKGHGGEAKLQKLPEEYNVQCRKIHGLPAYYKDLPPTTASASYWYGFVCGFLAADGSADIYGCVVLTQKSKAALEAIEAQLPRLGMVAGPVRGYDMEVYPPGCGGKPHFLTMHYMTLLKRFMTVDDLLLESHRAKFVTNTTSTKYGEYVGIKSVVRTGVTESVYCCEEPVTHAFVVDNGIVTGNCYGNSFTSLIVPFRRYLSCPGCGLELPLKKVYNTPDFKFNWSGFTFNASCPHCQFSGEWKHIDRRSGESGQIKVKRWSPHDMDILWDPYTDDSSYIWKIPDDYRNLLRKGHLHHLERASWEVVQAVQGNQALLFDPDVIYHMKEDALAGARPRGWGLSRVLVNFRQAWYVAVLHRFNEAIALDYVIPFRVITPQPRPGAGGETNDPVLSINMGSFTSRVQQMLKQRRRDPARWNILPFPIDYQALGGDATQLAPKDLLELGMDTLLTAIGVPVDLYKGSLTVQSAPAALRLFEANWSHLVHNLNRFLNKLVDKVSQVMSWEPVNCRLQRVTHADDLNKQMAHLQLMMGGQISRTTGLGSVGLEFAEEERRKLEEERISAEATEDMQQELEQAALMDEMAIPQDAMGPVPGDPAAAAGGAPPMGGAPPAPGGAPPAPGGAPPMGGAPPAPGGAPAQFAAGQPLVPWQPTTPEEMESVASTLAQQAMAMPDSQKQSFLIQLKKENSTIHSLVKSHLDSIKEDAQRDGGNMLLEQQYPKQAMYPAGKELRSIIFDD